MMGTVNDLVAKQRKIETQHINDQEVARVKIGAQLFEEENKAGLPRIWYDLVLKK